MKFFKKKSIKQIADWSLWHEIKKRELIKNRFKFSGISIKICTISIKKFTKAVKNTGYSIKEFNKKMIQLKGITEAAKKLGKL